MKYEVTDFTVCGKCSHCGQCCSNFLPLTESEKTRLQNLVKNKDVEVQHKSYNNTFIMMCPFLIMNNETNKTYCSIYNDRPLICRLFKCNETRPKIPPIKMQITDMWKDIIHYDYQKEVGMTYQECMNAHLMGSFKTYSRDI